MSHLQEFESRLLALEKKTDEIWKLLNSMNDSVEPELSIVSGESGSLFTNDKKTLALVAAITDQVAEKVYKEVVDEINEKIVPQVNNMVEWVNYNTQDGGEVVDRYRRAAELQANKIDPTVKFITDGKHDKRIISEHVRTFFGGPDDDSSTD